jgi:cytochrome oxidase assembly protein ShyY1
LATWQLGFLFILIILALGTWQLGHLATLFNPLRSTDQPLQLTCLLIAKPLFRFRGMELYQKLMEN